MGFACNDFVSFLSFKEKDSNRNPFDYANRHSSDALDRGSSRVLEITSYYAGSSMEMTQFERHRPSYNNHQQHHQRLIQRTASSDVASDDQVILQKKINFFLFSQ